MRGTNVFVEFISGRGKPIKRCHQHFLGFSQTILNSFYSFTIRCLMSSKLSFGSKFKDHIILCDYCRYYKCDWVNATPQKHPDICLKPKKFEIADDYLPRYEFLKRVEIAKKIGVYVPQKKKWQFSIRRAGALSGEELAEIIDTVNTWSEKNNFKLTEMMRYKEREWF